MIKRLRWAAVPVLLLLLAGCTPEEPKTVVLAPEYAAMLSGDLATFEGLANGGTTRLDPARARLVGATYGVALDAAGIATSFDGLAYESNRRHLHPDDIGLADRGPRTPSEGYEFLLAHVRADDHLPEPETGWANMELDGWRIQVDGQYRPYGDGDLYVPIGTGSIYVVSVRIGGDALLVARQDCRAISLRTGAVVEDLTTCPAQ